MKRFARAVGAVTVAVTCLGGCADEQERAPTLERHGQALRPQSGSCAKAQRKAIELAPLGTYHSGVFAEGAAEIVAHDPRTQQLFVVNAAAARVDVLGLRDPAAPTLVASLDLSAYGAVVNSVAVHAGQVAAAVEAAVKTEPGKVVLLDAESLLVSAVFEVGALPDMLTFTPNGRYLVVANEGEPSDDYSVDPEGSVSIIDVRAGSVRTARFDGFERGRLDPRIRTFGPNASVAQDLEPEYIAVSDDSRRAWVTLQENNALAIVDLRGAKVEELVALDVKDHRAPGNGLDASDRDDAIAIASWPVFGMYQPDSIAAYKVRGETYLVLANEGDARDYDGFSEEARVGALSLDPAQFPGAETMQAAAQLGRLKVTSALGDRDGDGDYDALYAFGARSFSIRTASGALVFDSGDALERITAEADPAHFNVDNESNTFDARSDDKGPEPEALTLGRVAGRTYAFIGLERTSGIVAYDISEPSEPCFIAYTNERDFSAAPDSPEAGDLGPEGLVFIRAEDSPSGRPLLVSANEVSGTTTVYEVRRVR